MKCLLWVFVVSAGLLLPLFPAQAVEAESIEKALRKAVHFFREHVATEGGYLWKYSSDMLLREGENTADDRTVWVQPPGTPTVGMSLLRAYQVTGDPYYLEAATEAGRCLVRGQLKSGGWAYQIYFDAARRATLEYRSNSKKSIKSTKNVSTLDDDTTQAATAFLAELDGALKFRDKEIHEAALFALDKILEAQFPNGAFPQRFHGVPHSLSEHPIQAASYPPEGTKPTRDNDYDKYYTFNDNLAHRINRMFYAVSEIYGTTVNGKLVPNPKYLGAARRVGDFIILAQMPEPQPAWAQQYDFEMYPCWARKFEPASITGGESQRLIDTLIELYYVTGDQKYLAPIPKAVAYLKRSQVADGKVARFYEFKTNKPLYFTKDYVLTYSDADTPTHYSFQSGLGNWAPVEELMSMDEKTRQKMFESLRNRYRNRSLPQADAGKAEEAVAALDDRGAWVVLGTLVSDQTGEKRPIIDSSVFVRNIDTLLAVLASSGKK